MTQADHISETRTALTRQQLRGDWLRLRTFINLRWIAILGQIAAILFAREYFALRFEMGWLSLVIGVAIVANLIFHFVFPENKRLGETETLLMLLFDVLQLLGMLYLTGGLHNPFIILILAPVTISATALHLRATLIVGAVVLAGITLLGFFHMPLRSEFGFVLRMPQIFLYGLWVALATAILFFAAYTHRVSSEINAMSQALLATQMALSREQKLTDLGGVVAAAAHELGTPLATIKLVSSELIEELEDDATLREDAELIRDQADRCREILRDMGRAGKDDTHLRSVPLSALIEEAADPHLDRGKEVMFDFHAIGAGGPMPIFYRQPEIIHGLRNFIQNAVDFADAKVWIELRWGPENVRLRITDDGPGFPTGAFGRLGEPFLRHRRSAAEKQRRKEYEGMGLGMFIAKTLLERCGAEISFANAADPNSARYKKVEKRGALIEVTWGRNGNSPETREARQALGENPRIT